MFSPYKVSKKIVYTAAQNVDLLSFLLLFTLTLQLLQEKSTIHDKNTDVHLLTLSYT